MATKRIKVYEVRNEEGAKHETVWHYADVKAALSRMHVEDGVRDPELHLYEITLEWKEDEPLTVHAAVALINRRDYAFKVEKVM
jgi:hypothetical protein